MKKEQELEAALDRMKELPRNPNSPQQAMELYKDKLFYEVIKIGPQEFRVIGPLDNIYYTSRGPGFLQVIDGKPVAYFTKDEIYVTKTPLVGGLSKLYEGALNENR